MFLCPNAARRGILRCSCVSAAFFIAKLQSVNPLHGSATSLKRIASSLCRTISTAFGEDFISFPEMKSAESATSPEHFCASKLKSIRAKPNVRADCRQSGKLFYPRHTPPDPDAATLPHRRALQALPPPKLFLRTEPGSYDKIPAKSRTPGARLHPQVLSVSRSKPLRERCVAAYLPFGLELYRTWNRVVDSDEN